MIVHTYRHTNSASWINMDSGNNPDLREEEDEDEVGEVLSEWKNHSEFKVKKFYRWLFPSALFSIYSFA